MKPILIRIAAACAAMLVTACAARDTRAVDPGFSLTVYSSADPARFDPQEYARQATANPNYSMSYPLPGYGIIREIRPIDLVAGANTIRFADVAAGIDATTVSFASLTDPAGTSVAEQNFEYDLVSSQKLLEKYVDKDVIVERQAGEGKTEMLAGKLLSARGGLVLREEGGGVRIVNSYTGVRLADAADLITRPTLVWSLSAAKAGKHDAQVSYQTNGITWRADYNLILNADDAKADVGAWVTLLNQSGKTYPNASLKLVAGDVQRVAPVGRGYALEKASLGASAGAGAAGFVEKSFFEYHLYTLGRQTTIPDRSTKQIELFPSRKDVAVQKTFVYYGVPEQYRSWFRADPYTDRDLGIAMNKKVDVYLLLQNKEANGMGMPLPAGRVRVNKRDDADGSLQFIGEDVIEHTPKDERVMVRLGSAFDIVGERKQTNFAVDVNARTLDETFEIKVRNHKREKVSVIIKENLYRWSNWEIRKPSDKWEKQDSRTIHFTVDVDPDGEKTVTYAVHYWW